MLRAKPPDKIPNGSAKMQEGHKTTVPTILAHLNYFGLCVIPVLGAGLGEAATAKSVSYITSC